MRFNKRGAQRAAVTVLLDNIGWHPSASKEPDDFAPPAAVS
jgi:hypothetical protein